MTIPNTASPEASSAVELHQLRDAVAGFLQGRSPSEVVRETMDTEAGFDPQLWREICRDLGLAGIAVPDEWGGAGAGTSELAVVFEETGAALLCSPLLATVGAAIPALLCSGDRAAQADLLPSLVDGTTTATLVLNGTLGPWRPESVTLIADRSGGDFRVSGEAPMVLDGHTADVILVVANTSAGPSLFAVSGDADGLTRRRLASLDRTRRVARLRFDAAPARLIGSAGWAADGMARVADLALIALAAEQLGGAQRCLDTAVRYAGERIQFGRAIGSFQAVKHRCADMLIRVEGARSAVGHAAAVADGREAGSLAIAAAVAKLAASEAFVAVALDAMRVHGGIGFTWEHDAHLYVRRAKSGELMFGDPDHHALRLAELVTD